MADDMPGWDQIRLPCNISRDARLGPRTDDRWGGRCTFEQRDDAVPYLRRQPSAVQQQPGHVPTVPAGTPGTLAAVAAKRALVLAGGGLAGIAWETGILRGIADESPGTAKAMLDADVLVGTSAGSTVAAQLGSGLGLDALFDRQTTESSTELNPNAGVDEITELFVSAMLTPNTTKAERLQK